MRIAKFARLDPPQREWEMFECVIINETAVPTPTRNRRVVHPFDTASERGGGVAFAVDDRPDWGPLNSHPNRAPAIT